MKIKLSGSTNLFNQLKVHVISIENIFNKNNDPAISNILDELSNYYQIISVKLLETEKIKYWERYHKLINMHEKPNLLKHSLIEKLLLDISKNKDIKKSMVDDIMNYISIKHLIPIIYFDKEKVKNYLDSLDKDSFEKIVVIDSDVKFGLNIKYKENFLMHSLGYFINNKVDLDLNTNSIIVFIFKLDFIDEKDCDYMIEDLKQLFISSFKPEIKEFLLDKNNREIEF